MSNHPETLIVPIDSLKPYDNSPRTHNRQQRRKLKKLLKGFGQVTPAIIDNNNEIVDGHAVWQALKDLGQTEIQVVRVANRSPAEIRALRLALNRVAEETVWDSHKLRTEFADLIQLGFDLDLTGFDSVEIDMALSLDEPASDAVEGALAKDLTPQRAVATVTGDVWCVGRHRIVCGDARDKGLISPLTLGRPVVAVFTDPPYNVRIEGNVSGLGRTRHAEFAMASGEMEPERFVAFLTDALEAMIPYLTDSAILYVAMDWRHCEELIRAGKSCGLELKNLCVWVKTNAGMGTFYRSQHELIFVWKHGNEPHQNNFELGQHGRTRTNVWRYAGVNTFGRNRMDLLGVHPTVKPVAMIADALKDVTRRGDLVLDPFLGSGSTLLAAEETGRCCIGVELDPGYVEVAVRRWQKMTGKSATHPVTGEFFDDYVERVGKIAENPAPQVPDGPGQDPGDQGASEGTPNGEG
jgi:DNA modification methylase